MATYYDLGGIFQADGVIRNFTTKRTHSSPSTRIEIVMTWAELRHHSAPNGILDPTALDRFRLGFRKSDTGTIYWTTKGLYNIWGVNAPAGPYTISCQSFAVHTALTEIAFGASKLII